MLRLWNHTSPINWAYKGPMQPAQIAQDPALKPMLTQDVVLYDNGEGVVYDFRYLSALVGMYAKYDEETGESDIDTSDPQAALDEVWRRMNAPKITQADIEAMVDDLGTALVENTTATDDLNGRVDTQEETSTDLQAQIDAQGEAIEELIALQYAE